MTFSGYIRFNHWVFFPKVKEIQLEIGSELNFRLFSVINKYKRKNIIWKVAQSKVLKTAEGFVQAAAPCVIWTGMGWSN